MSHYVLYFLQILLCFYDFVVDENIRAIFGSFMTVEYILEYDLPVIPFSVLNLYTEE